MLLKSENNYKNYIEFLLKGKDGEGIFDINKIFINGKKIDISKFEEIFQLIGLTIAPEINGEGPLYELTKSIFAPSKHYFFRSLENEKIIFESHWFDFPKDICLEEGESKKFYLDIDKFFGSPTFYRLIEPLLEET